MNDDEGGLPIPRIFVTGGYMDKETPFLGKDMELIRGLAMFIARFRFDIPLRLSKWLWDQTIFNWPVYIPRTFIRRKDE